MPKPPPRPRRGQDSPTPRNQGPRPGPNQGKAPAPGPRRHAAPAAGPHRPRKSAPRTPKAEGEDRLQKIMAHAGVGSRRACEEMILQGRVTVDGKVVRELATRVDPRKAPVAVDGQRVQAERMVYFAVNKPKGYVSTNNDPSGRPRVVDLLPEIPQRVYTVGRLDEMSVGLMLLTNDGELANKLAHPKFGVEKVYRVVVAGAPTAGGPRQADRGRLAGRGEGPRPSDQGDRTQGRGDRPGHGPGRGEEPRGPADAGQARPQGHGPDPRRHRPDHPQGPRTPAPSAPCDSTRSTSCARSPTACPSPACGSASARPRGRSPPGPSNIGRPQGPGPRSRTSETSRDRADGPPPRPSAPRAGRGGHRCHRRGPPRSGQARDVQRGTAPATARRPSASPAGPPRAGRGVPPGPAAGRGSRRVETAADGRAPDRGRIIGMGHSPQPKADPCGSPLGPPPSQRRPPQARVRGLRSGGVGTIRARARRSVALPARARARAGNRTRGLAATPARRRGTSRPAPTFASRPDGLRRVGSLRPALATPRPPGPAPGRLPPHAEGEAAPAEAPGRRRAFRRLRRERWTPPPPRTAPPSGRSRSSRTSRSPATPSACGSMTRRWPGRSGPASS